MNRITIILFVFASAFISCNNEIKKERLIITIQPFNDFSKTDLEVVVKELSLYFDSINILKPTNLPQNAYYKPKSRYRADSLLLFLAIQNTKVNFLLGLTNKDISTTKGDVQDWGIMGLGSSGNHVCIVSTYRLSKSNKDEQLKKVVLHELGHTFGLPHCENKSCFMRDAKGGNPLNEEIHFCEQCRVYLSKKGWHL